MSDLRSSIKVEGDGLPDDIQTRVTEFEHSIGQIEDIFKSLERVPLSDLHSQMSSLDKAKLDLLGAYAVNSLFWVYLKINGEETKDHAIHEEINRVKSYMSRVHEVEDKAKAPRLDKSATKRFIRNALWDAAQKTEKTNKRKSINEDDKTSNYDRGTPPTKAAKFSP